MFELENKKLLIKIYQENLDIYKKLLNEIMNIQQNDCIKENFNNYINDLLNTENLILIGYTIHLESQIIGLKHKLNDYENKLDEKYSEDTHSNLANDHIFCLKNILISGESKINQLTHLIHQFKEEKPNCTFEIEIKSKDEQYFNATLKSERDKMSQVFKKLKTEETRKCNLVSELKKLKNSIFMVKFPNQIIIKSINSDSKYSKNTISIKNKQIDSMKNKDKVDQIEILKKKLYEKTKKIDELNTHVFQSKMEFNSLRDELNKLNTELTNKNNEVNRLELICNKLKLKGTIKQSYEILENDFETNHNF